VKSLDASVFKERPKEDIPAIILQIYMIEDGAWVGFGGLLPAGRVRFASA
jgi:hypothetical protein